MSLRRSHSVPYSLIAISVLALDWGIASTGNAAPIRQGTGADATCEVVSVGQWYCTIDGKGYYCDTNNNPDKNKNCRPARIAPTGPKGNLNQGMLRNQQIMRRGVEGDGHRPFHAAVDYHRNGGRCTVTAAVALRFVKSDL